MEYKDFILFHNGVCTYVFCLTLQFISSLFYKAQLLDNTKEEQIKGFSAIKRVLNSLLMNKRIFNNAYFYDIQTVAG